MELYIVGGMQKQARTATDLAPDWYDYKEGLILKVDTTTKKVKPVFNYKSQPHAHLEGDSVLFKSGSIQGDSLYLCTQTEVMIVDAHTFEQKQYISHRFFNDVHHVIPDQDENLVIANTGLDMVLRLSPTGEMLDSWNVLFQDPWAKVDHDLDYRLGVSTKPHEAHPNYVFMVDDDVWATRFEKRDAVCLTDRSKQIKVDIERVHDGYLHEGQIYFTTVDGHVAIYNADTLDHVRTICLGDAHPENTLLGWCRGLFVTEDVMWVGFSRIRPTRFRNALSWIRTGFQKSMPTHIACYCLKTGACLEEIDLEPYGLNAVFSVLPFS